MSKRWMIYGANGYTATLVAEQAVALGMQPVLAGRNAEKVQPIAQRMGLATRIFPLSDFAAMVDALRDIDAIAHLAGPFSQTSQPMVEACLEAKTHYLDITGECSVFEAVLAKDESAKAAGVALIPGVGFDVVPTDCLAAKLKALLPDAVELEMAIGGFGGNFGSISRGTLKTMVESIHQSSFVRREGKIVEVPFTWRTPQIDFPHGTRQCVTAPVGDIVTAYRSTGIPNIAVYFEGAPRVFAALSTMQPLFKPNFVRRALQQIVQWTKYGPDQQARAKARSSFWGRVTNTSGQSATLTMNGPEGYNLTVAATIKAVQKVLSGSVAAGTHTPSTAFGAGFIDDLDGIEIHQV